MSRANRQHEARRPQHAQMPRRGFTLIELMVVMGIVVLMLGMGVLAFNALTGRRSLSMAQNQVAGMLGRARAVAMNQPGNDPVAYGVFFFVDPQADRTAMAILRVPPTNSSDPDPNDNYKAWTNGVLYHVGDHVVAVVTDTSIAGRMLVTARRFQALRQTVGAYTNRPPTQANTYPAYNDYWIEVTQMAGADIAPGEEVQYLPVGISVQTMPEETTPAALDRYLRTGAILFDRQGRLEYLPYQIMPASTIGAQMGLTAPLIPPLVQLYSQSGLVLYETEPFRNQPGFSEADRTFQLPGQALPLAVDEANEETWLDQNTSLLLVNRYSGELLRAR